MSSPNPAKKKATANGQPSAFESTDDVALLRGDRDTLDLIRSHYESSTEPTAMHSLHLRLVNEWTDVAFQRVVQAIFKYCETCDEILAAGDRLLAMPITLLLPLLSKAPHLGPMTQLLEQALSPLLLDRRLDDTERLLDGLLELKGNTVASLGKRFGDATINEIHKDLHEDSTPTNKGKGAYTHARTVLHPILLGRQKHSKNRHKNTSTYLRKINNLLPNYRSGLLLTRRSTESSYRYLLQLISRLAPIAVQDDTQLQRAIRQFVDLFQPSCWTAYVFDEHANQISCLDNGGLDFPHCLHGLLMTNSVPALILLDRPDFGVYHGKEWARLDPANADQSTATAQIHGTATFCQRERIDPDKSVAVKLTVGEWRVAIFLNWRIDVEATITPRTMVLSARYLSAWFVEHASLLEEGFEQSWKAQNFDVPKLIFNIMRETIESHDEASALGSALTSVAPQGGHVRLHWAEDGRHLRIPKINRDGEQLWFLDTNHGAVARWKEWNGRVTADEQAWEIDCHDRDNETLVVKHGITALACSFRTSVQVDYARNDHGTKVLRGLRLHRSVAGKDGQPAEKPSAYELAMPVYNGDSLLGVLSAESPREEFPPTCLRLLELTGQLFARLYQIKTKDPLKCAGVAKSLMKAVPPGLASSFQPVARVLCQWLRQTMGAELAYILVHDSAHLIFRALGTSASRELIDSFLVGDDLRHLLGGDSADRDEFIRYYRGGRAKDALEQTPDHEERIVHRLFEHAIVSRLRPLHRSERGKTERLFRREIPAVVRGFGGRDLGPKYLKWRCAFPFVADRLRARPIGVVWLGFGNRPSFFGADDEVSDDIDKAKRLLAHMHEENTWDVVELAAAICSLLMDHNPDMALHPIPYEAPTA